MLVCGHGDIADYCSEHGMVVADTYKGDIRDYRGLCRVIVTDARMSELEYYCLKSELMSNGYKLVSTIHKDTELSASLMPSGDKSSHPGRCRFGLRRVNGELLPHKDRIEVVRRILELRDRGYSLHKIQDDEQVRHDDGRVLSISTIQLIIKNRDKYDEYL